MYVKEDSPKIHVLVDTCVWIDFLKYEHQRNIINKILENKDCIICINDIILFELEIGIKSFEEKNLWIETLKKFVNLPFSSDIFKTFNEYKLMVTEKDIKSLPGAADGLIAAQVIKAKRDLILLTSNHKDFSTKIFDRLETHWVDIDRPYTYCFYKAK